MIYIKLFRDMKKNILPENGRFLLQNVPGSCGALQVRTQDTFSSYKLDDLADFRRFHGMSSPCFKMLVFIYNYRHIVTVLKSKCQPRWENANL